MQQISRREFVALTAAGAGAVRFAPAVKGTGAAITALDVVDRIKARLGVDWRAETVDTFKAGDPATAVTGIVTTAMATLDVLRQAVKRGANLVITCEPTFYSKADTPTPPPRRGGGPGGPPDRVFGAKDELIRSNRLVVFRFGEHWRLRKPDPCAQGLIDALGWSTLTSGGEPSRATVPELRLDALAARIKSTLGARGGIRVVGDPGTTVRTVGVLPGVTPLPASLKLLPGVDAILAGEVREWESVEYARDTVTAGGRKGLILVGRVLSEDPGMNVCARWLGTIVPEVRTTWVPAGDPYWRPL
jgi:putative NIF3 family GTP cyclohydrolase 1 type 2